MPQLKILIFFCGNQILHASELPSASSYPALVTALCCTRRRAEDDTVCSAVYGYLRCALVSRQRAVYGHYQCGYRCGVVRLPVQDTS